MLILLSGETSTGVCGAVRSRAEVFRVSPDDAKFVSSKKKVCVFALLFNMFVYYWLRFLLTCRSIFGSLLGRRPPALIGCDVASFLALGRLVSPTGELLLGGGIP